MIRDRLFVLVIGFSVALATIATQVVRAHHSEAAEYDSTKPVQVSGTLMKVEWKNPHVWFYVDVMESNGKVTTWGFSTAPPGALMRRGAVENPHVDLPVTFHHIDIKPDMRVL